MEQALTAELRALEERLLRPEVRKSAAELAALLDDEFREIGASGRSYTKAQVLEALGREPETRFEAGGFAATALGADAALLTFRVARLTADGGRVESLRSSIWRRRDGRWRLLFHQGTPAPRAQR